VKTKKTVSAAVLNANRANGQSSTGPTTQRGKSNSGHNSLRHGLLARKMVFQSDAQKSRFHDVLNQCSTDLAPKGIIEELLVQDIATLLWKISLAEKLVTEELNKHQELSDDLQVFNHLELPISRGVLPLDGGWDCEQLIVRAVVGKEHSTSGSLSGPALMNNLLIKEMKRSNESMKDETQHFEVHAVLTKTLEKWSRYQSSMRRELYRAIEMFHEEQSKRKERDT
jgi:hypothetical protein